MPVKLVCASVDGILLELLSGAEIDAVKLCGESFDRSISDRIELWERNAFSMHVSSSYAARQIWHAQPGFRDDSCVLVRPARCRHHTFGLNTVITRCSNNYGPYQFPEKLIPLFITNVMADIPVPVYGDGRQVRDWIYVLDHCRGIDAALRQGQPGEIYNFGGKSERYNIDVTRAILKQCDKPETLIRYVTDRLGHDRRYAINCDKAEKELGWRPTVAFEEGLTATITWYKTHMDWVDRVRSGAYRTANN